MVEVKKTRSVPISFIPPTAHGDIELEITLNAVRASLGVYAKALNDGIGKYLKGVSIKPVFRRYN